MNGFLVAAVSGLVAYLVIKQVIKGQQKAPLKAEEGRQLLTFPAFYKAFGIVLTILGGLMIFIFPFWDVMRSDTFFLLMMLFMGLTIGGSGIFLLMYAYNHRCWFDQVGLTVKSPSGKTHSMAWNEIKKVEYKPSKRAIYFSGPQGNVKLSSTMTGINHLLAEIEAQTGWKISV